MLRVNNKKLLPTSQINSVLYHDLFDYPLNKEDIQTWNTGKRIKTNRKSKKIVFRKGFYFLEGRQSIIKKRLENESFSKKKLITAKKAAKFISFIPWVQMVGVTGSLAMKNAGKDSDIDLMFIVSAGTLWTTRILVNILLSLFGFSVRRVGVKEEKDKLCLNVWLDDSDMLWRKKNMFTAHEIVQVIPLINKNETWERFVWENRWVVDFWPRATEVKKVQKHFSFWNFGIVEELLFKIQYLYMKRKITNENVSANRALFHPVDLSQKIRI